MQLKWCSFQLQRRRIEGWKVDRALLLRAWRRKTLFTSMRQYQRKRVEYRGDCICGSSVRIGTNTGTGAVPESPPASVKQQKLSRPRGLHHWPSELATLENTLFAFPPISRIVPTTITSITASITAYSAMSWPSSFDHI